MGEVWFSSMGANHPRPFSGLPSSPLALEVGSLPSIFPFALSPSFPLEVGPFISSYKEVWGSAVSSSSWVWGRAPAEM